MSLTPRSEIFDNKDIIVVRTEFFLGLLVVFVSWASLVRVDTTVVGSGCTVVAANFESRIDWRSEDFRIVQIIVLYVEQLDYYPTKYFKSCSWNNGNFTAVACVIFWRPQFCHHLFHTQTSWQRGSLVWWIVSMLAKLDISNTTSHASPLQ